MTSPFAERNKAIAAEVDSGDMTLREIGAIYGLTKERVRQIAHAAGARTRYRRRRMYQIGDQVRFGCRPYHAHEGHVGTIQRIEPAKNQKSLFTYTVSCECGKTLHPRSGQFAPRFRPGRLTNSRG